MSEREALLNRPRAEPDVLTRQQVNQCLMDIQDTHPLKEKARLEHILPICKRCKKKDKPNFKHSVKLALLSELDLPLPENDEEIEEDPFLLLGYGLNAYFDVLLSAVSMFLVLTVAVIPLFYYYSNNGVNELAAQGGVGGFVASLSLGNLGGARALCDQRRLQNQKLKLSCPAGTVLEYGKENFGLLSNMLSESNYCLEKAIWDVPGNKGREKCTDKLKKDIVKKQLATCRERGNSTCLLKFNDFLPKEDMTKECNDRSFFFIQMACVVPPEMVSGRLLFGLFAGCVGVFIYLFCVVYFDYIKCVQKSVYVDYDIKTITAADYSVEFAITAEQYEHWQAHYLQEDNPMSEMAQFKQYVQEILESRLDQMEHFGVDGPENIPVKIAQITFAFRNQKVIDWLTERGKYLQNEQWEKVDEVNKEISEAIKDQELLDALQRPCSVFAMFETEEGVTRARHLNEHVLKRKLPKSFAELLGAELDLQSAAEPSDIIWENRWLSDQTRRFRRVIVAIVIALMLAASAFGIYYLQSKANELKTRYPRADCDLAAKGYESPAGKLDLEQWQSDAVREFVVQNKRIDEGERPQFTDIMQCFCQNQKKAGEHRAQKYTGTVDGETQTLPICEDFFSDKFKGTIIGYAITGVIIAVNEVLRMAIIALITWVGEDTQSERLTSITNGIFFAQFFNTGLLLLLVNANLTEYGVTFMAGPYTDYTPDWYADVGATIVRTMVINSFMPYVNLCVAFILPSLKAYRDSRGDVYKTKQTAMAGFKAVYAGSDYVIHFKYSAMLNVVFVTMMYGFGMPILFPVAAVTLVNVYVVERIVVAKLMCLPPALNKIMTDNAITLLILAPMLFLLQALWMTGNPQIFENSYTWLKQDFDAARSGHKFFQLRSQAVYFINFVSIFYLIVSFVVPDQIIQKLGFSFSEKEIEVDEDLPALYQSLTTRDAQAFIKSNEHMMNTFGFEFQDPDTIEALSQIKSTPIKQMTGTPWYHLMTNPYYVKRFNYIGSNIAEREKLIEDGYEEEYEDSGKLDKKGKPIMQLTERCANARIETSDMIMILLNLAYIPDSVAKELEFSPGWSKKFHEDMNKYKKNWSEKHGKEWIWQCEATEQSYKEYMHAKAMTDSKITVKTVASSSKSNDKFKKLRAN